MLEGANTTSPLPWYVCSPSGSGSPSFSYDFSARPGVLVAATPVPGTGCVRITTTLTKDYAPADPARKDCVDPWDQLTAQAEAATGNANLDIKKLIEAQVPASFVAAVERDPVVDCYEPLTGPALMPVGAGSTVTTSTAQSFPFYGWVKVSG
jgi:hypothetical protein